MTTSDPITRESLSRRLRDLSAQLGDTAAALYTLAQQEADEISAEIAIDLDTTATHLDDHANTLSAHQEPRA